MTDHFAPCPACHGNGYIVRERDDRKPLPQVATCPCPECDGTGIAEPARTMEDA